MSIEKRVHPIPFRTRKLSASSPMILRIFTWESRPMPRLSLERLLFRSLSSFKGCSHRAALFYFRAGASLRLFSSGASCGLLTFALSEAMTVCRRPDSPLHAGEGKRRGSGLSCGRGGVDDAGPGIYGFLPEHEFWGRHNLLHYKSGVFGTERLACSLTLDDLLMRAGKSAWSPSHGGIILPHNVLPHPARSVFVADILIWPRHY